MTQPCRRALFLDRDGVINIDRGYVCSQERTQWVPGIFDLCRKARELGYLLVVVTNQAGIARGYYSEAEFEDYKAWMHDVFAEQGVPITATYHCPHHPTQGLGPLRLDCNCRKPMPGMLLQAQHDLCLDLAHCVLVGDMASDIRAAQAAGVGRYLQVAPQSEPGSDMPTVADAIGWLASLHSQQGNSN